MVDTSKSKKIAVLSREGLTRFFLWISVIAWGILLGGKLFDLIVLVGAWSASPPDSLNLLPYGLRYPVDTGDYFIPSSAILLLATMGALISGWKTPAQYRILLMLSATMIFTTLVFTVVAFWPRNAALWAIAQNAPNSIKEVDAILVLVRQWVVFDWFRIIMGIIGYVSAIRAISIPYPPIIEVSNPSLGIKILYGICIGIVILFIIYFVQGLL